MNQREPTDLLAAASVEAEVFRLRPDYRALLIAVAGVRGGAGDESSEAALRAAEESARARLSGAPPESLPEIAAWRQAFLGFGVKPRAARSSVEALLRRVDAGLPRIDRLTDLYNAVSIAYLLPVGGEDLDRYDGPPRLVRAVGGEAFDTIANGEPATAAADPGEVVWRDDAGVTCRRWNWRQCVRTRLDASTSSILLIIDALEPITTGTLEAAGDALVGALVADGPGAVVARRLIADR